MTKKKVKTKVAKKKGKVSELSADLPQNIRPVGERVLEDKNIYIHQKVYSQIHKFAVGKTENEHGGVLVGRVVNEMGKENTIIEGFIEAKYNNATPTTLTFTHDTWGHFHEVIDKKFRGMKIVGWIHTHPDFGIFLSENDKFIQNNFFTDANQVAYVVDPIQRDEGFFFWVNDNLEKCPGFYVFDKNGAKINAAIWNEVREDADGADSGKALGTRPWVAVALAAVLFFNLILSVNQAVKINQLEKQLADNDIVTTLLYTGGNVTMLNKTSVAELAVAIRQQLAFVEEERVRAALKQQQEMLEKAQGENPQEDSEASAVDVPQTGETLTENPATSQPAENNEENNGGQE